MRKAEALSFLFLALLTACGEAGNSPDARPGADARPAADAAPPDAAPLFTVGGTITGLTQTGLTLANGADTINVGAGASAFEFATALPSGSTYAVMITNEPTDEMCSVTDGGGTIAAADVTNVAVSCTPRVFPLAGTVNYFEGSLVLQNNGGSDLTVNAGAMSFQFPMDIAVGSPYAITILTQPTDGVCTVENGTGTVPSGGIVVGVTVQCLTTKTFAHTGAAQQYTVPAGVDVVRIEALGASGAQGATGGNASLGGLGGLGGRAAGGFDVAGGEVLDIIVGGVGTTTAGGFGGGGNGANNAGGGGGRSAVSVGATQLVVAGGGGGGGRGGCEMATVGGGAGGAGGGGAGVNGTNAPTSGGVAGGGAGAPVGGAFGARGVGCAGFLGSDGVASAGRNGGNGGPGQSCCCFTFGSVPGGGGGGGGFVGGGGGGGGSAGTTGCSGNDKGAGGGGAGGTSHVDATLLNPVTENGMNPGNGAVTLRLR